jgi:hypothetical protein
MLSLEIELTKRAKLSLVVEKKSINFVDYQNETNNLHNTVF